MSNFGNDNGSNNEFSNNGEQAGGYWRLHDIPSVFPNPYPGESYEDATARHLEGRDGVDASMNRSTLSPHSSQPSAQKKRPGGLQGLASSSPRQNHPSSPQGPASSPPRQHVPGGLQGFGSSPPGQAHFGGYNAHPQPPNFGPYGGPFGGAPVGTNTTAKKASGASKPATPSGKVIIDLQMGFEWNRESLALLCKWREVNKKGAKFIVATGAFPGHTIESLDAAWADHRTEARKFYKEVFGKNSS